MEAQGGGGASGGGGSGEVRRIHVIYFLSRKGRIEHPHLIRVHHLSRNGVRLRDVKRWLTELRGKDMPESFAWSYKRRYKTGFVWQDLLDEDLITPISDNEYVLKGSEIPSINFGNPSHGEKKVVSMHKDLPTPRNHKLSSSEEEIQDNQETTTNVSTKPPSETEEQSPPFGSEASTLTDDSMKLEEEKHLDPNKHEKPGQSDKFENSSFYSTLFNKQRYKKVRDKNNNNKVESPGSTTTRPGSSSSTTSSSFTKSKSYSGSNMLRNIISCGAVDTKDSVMVMVKRHDMNSCYVPIDKPEDSACDYTAEICRGDKLGGSDRIFGNFWNHQQPLPNARKSCDGVNSSNNSKSTEFNSQKPVPAAYKPVNRPTCSQCGKMFKPEKMHSHMKSCRGMKSLSKGTRTSTGASASESRRSMDSSCEESVSGYYLTNTSY